MSCSRLKNGTLKYTSEEVEDMFPPQHWEFTKSPWYFGLLVKIFRRDPQLALHVADVMTDSSNLPVSRAAMRQQKQQTALQHQKNKRNIEETTPSPPSTDSSVLSTTMTPITNVSSATLPPASTKTTSAHQDKLLWAKVMASKAHAETANVAKRMGKMEELEKGMALLEKMKPYIGAEVYANRVCSLFAALPNFETFDTAVDIIDVDAHDDERCWGTTKRRLSSDDEGWTRIKRMKSTTDVDDNVPNDSNSAGCLDADDDEEEEGTPRDDEGGSEFEGQKGGGNGKHDFVTSCEDDEDKYITDHEIVDGTTGKVVTIHAVDSRAPEDAADNQRIPFTEVKDDNGNVFRRIYGEYKKK
jgi:hypothetical protein